MVPADRERMPGLPEPAFPEPASQRDPRESNDSTTGLCLRECLSRIRPDLLGRVGYIFWNIPTRPYRQGASAFACPLAICKICVKPLDGIVTKTVA